MGIELVSSAWHVFSAFFVFFGGVMLAPWLGKLFQIKPKRALILYIWHTIFCMVYMLYVMNYGGDSIGYYLRASEGVINIEFGTFAVDFLTYFVVLLTGVSFLGLFLFFNIFGFIGLLAYDASLQVATKNNVSFVKKMAAVAIFLPSVSFWSSGVGKDSLSFMAIGLALWAALEIRHRMKLMAFAILIMLIVRPHMAGIMVMALAAAMVISYKGSFKTRMLVGCMALAASAVLVPLGLSYAGLGDFGSLMDVEEYINQRQGYNMDGGGGIDISSMNLPEKLFTYLFRPFVFEAKNMSFLAASIDNAFLLILLVFSIIGILRKRSPQLIGLRIFMWFYALAAWFILASTTANLGIAVRQKWMFVPVLIFLLLPFAGRLHRTQGTPLR